MQASAKADYGLRAMLELTARSQEDTDDLVSAEDLAHAQGLPAKFLEGILNQLRRSGLVISRRGVDGGYRLAKPADQITVAEVIRAIEGPLAGVRGVAPEDVAYDGAALHLREVWIATRSAMRDVLESVTLGDALTGEFDAPVGDLLARHHQERRGPHRGCRHQAHQRRPPWCAVRRQYGHPPIVRQHSRRKGDDTEDLARSRCTLNVVRMRTGRASAVSGLGSRS